MVECVSGDTRCDLRSRARASARSAPDVQSSRSRRSALLRSRRADSSSLPRSRVPAGVRVIPHVSRVRPGAVSARWISKTTIDSRLTARQPAGGLNARTTSRVPSGTLHGWAGQGTVKPSRMTAVDGASVPSPRGSPVSHCATRWVKSRPRGTSTSTDRVPGFGLMTPGRWGIAAIRWHRGRHEAVGTPVTTRSLTSDDHHGRDTQGRVGREVPGGQRPSATAVRKAGWCHRGWRKGSAWSVIPRGRP